MICCACPSSRQKGSCAALQPGTGQQRHRGPSSMKPSLNLFGLSVGRVFWRRKLLLLWMFGLPSYLGSWADLKCLNPSTVLAAIYCVEEAQDCLTPVVLLGTTSPWCSGAWQQLGTRNKGAVCTRRMFAILLSCSLCCLCVLAAPLSPLSKSSSWLSSKDLAGRLD